MLCVGKRAIALVVCPQKSLLYRKKAGGIRKSKRRAGKWILLHGGQKRTKALRFGPLCSQINRCAVKRQMDKHMCSNPARNNAAHTGSAAKQNTAHQKTEPKRETPADRKRTPPQTPPTSKRKTEHIRLVLVYAQTRAVSSMARWAGGMALFLFYKPAINLTSIFA